MLPVGTYSFYNQFQNCPHKAQHLYVLRDIPYVESEEMKWGNQVHKAMERRLRNAVPLPDNMQAAEPLAAQLCGLGLDIEPELYIGMTATGQHCSSSDDNVWFRGKIDCPVITNQGNAAWIVDWKTGNEREEPFELETSALLLKVMYPALENIVANYFWLKLGKAGIRYTCNDHSRTFAKLQALRSEAERYEDNAPFPWPKRKNPLCGWCPVLSCENNTSHKRRK
jgi:PD-(D/E)XK nuclease superfamily